MAQRYFQQKPSTKDTLQLAILLVFNESVNTQIALYTYLRLTLNENYVGWAKVIVLGNIQLLAVTAKAIKGVAGATTRLKSLE